MYRCPDCHEYRFKTPCGCTQYRCWHEDDEGWEYLVYAIDRQEAAEKYAIHHNEGSGDYPMLNGEDSITVTVEQDDHTRTRHRVSAEATVAYWVHDLPDEHDGD